MPIDHDNRPAILKYINETFVSAVLIYIFRRFVAHKHISVTIQHLFINDRISGIILNPFFIICNITISISTFLLFILFLPIFVLLFGVRNEILIVVIVPYIIPLKVNTWFFKITTLHLATLILFFFRIDYDVSVHTNQTILTAPCFVQYRTDFTEHDPIT